MTLLWLPFKAICFVLCVQTLVWWCPIKKTMITRTLCIICVCLSLSTDAFHGYLPQYSHTTFSPSSLSCRRLDSPLRGGKSYSSRFASRRGRLAGGGSALWFRDEDDEEVTIELPEVKGLAGSKGDEEKKLMINPDLRLKNPALRLLCRYGPKPAEDFVAIIGDVFLLAVYAETYHGENKNENINSTEHETQPPLLRL